MSSVATNSTETLLVEVPGMTRRSFMRMSARTSVSVQPPVNTSGIGSRFNVDISRFAVIGAAMAGAPAFPHKLPDFAEHPILLVRGVETNAAAERAAREFSRTTSAMTAVVSSTSSEFVFGLYPAELSSAVVPTGNNTAAPNLQVLRHADVNEARKSLAATWLYVWLHDQDSVADVADVSPASFDDGPVAAAIRKVESFANLGPRWGGPDTELPSASARQYAVAFLQELPADLPVPHVSPSADGMIGFEWETERDFLAVDFTADEMIWHHRRDRRFVYGEETKWTGAIPVSLLNGLRQSFG